MDFRKSLPFKSYGVKKPICKSVRAPFSRSFGTNETQQLREGQLVGRMLLQRLATGVKQARYRQGPTRAARHPYAHAQYTLRVYCIMVLGPASSACRRGFCTFINPRRACARVTVVCLSVCVSVCSRSSCFSVL